MTTWGARKTFTHCVDQFPSCRCCAVRVTDRNISQRHRSQVPALLESEHRCAPAPQPANGAGPPPWRQRLRLPWGVLAFLLPSVLAAKCPLGGLICFCLRTSSCQCFPHLLLATERHPVRKRDPLLRATSCKSRDNDVQEPEPGGGRSQESRQGDGRAEVPLLSGETWEQERCGADLGPSSFCRRNG